MIECESARSKFRQLADLNNVLLILYVPFALLMDGY